MDTVKICTLRMDVGAQAERMQLGRTGVGAPRGTVVLVRIMCALALATLALGYGCPCRSPEPTVRALNKRTVCVFE